MSVAVHLFFALLTCPSLGEAAVALTAIPSRACMVGWSPVKSERGVVVSSHRPRTARTTVALICAVVALLVAACGGSADDRRVTIGHSLGQTNVDGVPARIVALGTQWLDATQALGVLPVGYIDDVEVVTGEPAPWEPSTLTDSIRIDPRGDVLAQVSELDPDLILIPGFAADEKNYRDLSKIAPTVPNLGNAQVDSWTAQLDILGKILDREGQAQSVVANLEGRIDAVAAKYPALKGKTYETVRVDAPTDITFVTNPEVGANALFTQLGMTLPEKLLAEVPTGRRTFPIERILEFPTDLLIVTAPTDDLATAPTAVPGFADMPAAQTGSIVDLNLAIGTGLDLLSPLSLPYVLDRLEPGFATVA